MGGATGLSPEQLHALDRGSSLSPKADASDSEAGYTMQFVSPPSQRIVSPVV